MAKRRSTIGKKGKHSRSGLGLSAKDTMRTSKRRKESLQIIAMIVVLAVVVLASAYYFLIYNPQSEEEKKALTTDTPHEEGYPDQAISFRFAIYNPDKDPDVFSPLVSGLPSDWEVSLPDLISVGGRKSKDGEFTVTPSPVTALNRTYTFMLSVTSGNTEHTYNLEYKLTVFPALYLICYNDSHDADPGGSTYYALIIKNAGNAEDTVDLSFDEAQLPVNWSLSFEFDSIDIPSFSSRVVICNITTYSNTSKGIYNITIEALSGSGMSDSILLRTYLIKDFKNETVESGDKIQVNYFGIFVDGVIFDTSYFHIANNSDYPKSEDFSVRDYYEPLKAVVATSSKEGYTAVIEGFREGVVGMKVNETKVIRIPPEKAYDDGKVRIFEITVVSIDE